MEKAEAKIKEKREKRGNEVRNKPLPALVQTMATATQVGEIYVGEDHQC